MNATFNNSKLNISTFNLEFWLSKVRAPWELEAIYLFVITPVAIVGVLLNTFSFVVLCQKEFHSTKIYRYFRCITFNSAVINLVESGLFACSAYRYLDFANTFEANTFGVYAYLPISNCCYLFGSCLDLLVSLERCSIFVNKLKRLFTYPVKYVCLICLAFCILLTTPYFYTNKPSFLDAPMSPTSFYRIWYWGITPFGNTLTGKILAGLSYFVRDLCFLIAEVTVNLISIHLFKKHYENKLVLLNLKKGETTAPDNTAAQKVDSTNLEPSTSGGNVEIERVEKKNSTIPLNKRITIMERNITLMIIVLCFFSILIHLFYLTTTIYYYFSYGLVLSLLGVCTVLTTTLKNVSNFFLLFIFNGNFRKCVRKIFSMKNE
jgi:hypothetical protein